MAYKRRRFVYKGGIVSEGALKKILHLRCKVSSCRGIRDHREHLGRESWAEIFAKMLKAGTLKKAE